MSVLIGGSTLTHAHCTGVLHFQTVEAVEAFRFTSPGAVRSKASNPRERYPPWLGRRIRVFVPTPLAEELRIRLAVRVGALQACRSYQCEEDVRREHRVGEEGQLGHRRAGAVQRVGVVQHVGAVRAPAGDES